MIRDIAFTSKEASKRMVYITSEEKNEALLKIAKAIEENFDYILTENEKDMEIGRKTGMSTAFLDRLLLTKERIFSISDAIRNVIKLPDPVGKILYEKKLHSGLVLKKVSVPIGVIGIIFEARPNVAPDATALCLKSSNTVILRGGSDAINSNKALVKVMRDALSETKIPQDAILLVEDTSHESVNELITETDFVDLVIPRGGKGLINAVVKNATVPVIETGAGVCHIYIDKDADIEMATNIVFNAKTSRPSVCNAAECILVHKDILDKVIPSIEKKLKEKNVEFRADDMAIRFFKNAKKATNEDWGKEYGDYILAVKTVSCTDEALDHISKYGTRHSECIVTENEETAEVFLTAVDASTVYHNASTRFTDGGEFEMGAEIGISTQKLHARGPLGLNELTTTKFKIYGEGQVR